jgi:hypothetical protein
MLPPYATIFHLLYLAFSPHDLCSNIITFFVCFCLTFPVILSQQYYAILFKSLHKRSLPICLYFIISQGIISIVFSTHPFQFQCTKSVFNCCYFFYFLGMQICLTTVSDFLK